MGSRFYKKQGKNIPNDSSIVWRVKSFKGDGGKLKAKQREMLEARRAGRIFKKAKCKKGLLENAERGIK